MKIPLKAPAAWQIWCLNSAAYSQTMVSSHASHIRALRLARAKNRSRAFPAFTLYTVRLVRPA